MELILPQKKNESCLVGFSEICTGGLRTPSNRNRNLHALCTWLHVFFLSRQYLNVFNNSSLSLLNRPYHDPLPLLTPASPPQFNTFHRNDSLKPRTFWWSGSGCRQPFWVDPCLLLCGRRVVALSVLGRRRSGSVTVIKSASSIKGVSLKWVHDRSRRLDNKS